MQKVKIPITLHPGKAAQHRLKYDGIVPLEKLTRLREVVQEVVFQDPPVEGPGKSTCQLAVLLIVHANNEPLREESFADPFLVQ